jgi:surface polysaccharide O-acyltransferase-like enzyme
LHLNAEIKFPGNRAILVTAALLGLMTFLTRLVFPVGWSLFPLGFQLGHFPQYVLMFFLGIVASKNKWLDQLDWQQGRKMASLARIMVLVILPVIFIAYLLAKQPDPNVFNGGWNPFSLTFAFWEQITGLTIMTALLSIAGSRWNSPSDVLNRLSANAFAVYVFHPLVLITLSLLIKPWSVDPVLKLLIMIPAALVCSFSFASLLRKIPFVRAVF